MRKQNLSQTRAPAKRPIAGAVRGIGTLSLLAGFIAAGVIWLGHREPALTPLPTPPVAPAPPGPPSTVDIVTGESKSAAQWEPEVAKLNQEAAELASSGEFAMAVELLTKALDSSPSDETLRGNLRATLINWGYGALRAENFPEAVSHFIQAQALGDRIEIERGLGYSYFRQGRFELARVALERGLRLEPNDEESYVTLGQTLLKLRDHGGAMEAFEQALGLGSNYPGVAETLVKLRRDADAELGYTKLESSHFTIKFEGGENLLAGRTILNGLEEAYRTVGARFGYYPQRRLEAVLYTNQVFEEVIKSPSWSGAIFDGKIRIPARGVTRGTERLQRTLRHEYAHSVILELTRGKLPAWLNEGLAQLCEGKDDRGRGRFLQETLVSRDLFPLSELEQPFIKLSGAKAKVAYAEAYFAALYLTKLKGQYNVSRLLKGLPEQESFAKGFEDILFLSYDVFEKRFSSEMLHRFGPR